MTGAELETLGNACMGIMMIGATAIVVGLCAALLYTGYRLATDD